MFARLLVSRWFAACALLGMLMVSTADAQNADAQRFRFAPPRCADGRCPVRPATFGYYAPTWRRPLEALAADTALPPQQGLLDDVPAFEPPPREQETNATPRGRTEPPTAPEALPEEVPATPAVPGAEPLEPASPLFPLPGSETRQIPDLPGADDANNDEAVSHIVPRDERLPLAQQPEPATSIQPASAEATARAPGRVVRAIGPSPTSGGRRNPLR